MEYEEEKNMLISYFVNLIDHIYQFSLYLEIYIEIR